MKGTSPKATSVGWDHLNKVNYIMKANSKWINPMVSEKFSRVMQPTPTTASTVENSTMVRKTTLKVQKPVLPKKILKVQIN